jgi:hypothetical protein
MDFDELLKQNKEYLEINKSIISLEKKLLETAPEQIRDLYLQIDFLCQKQKTIELDLMKKFL